MEETKNKPKFLVAIFLALALAISGIGLAFALPDEDNPYGELQVTVSNGADGYQYVATSLGSDPAAQAGFDLVASFDGSEDMALTDQVTEMQKWIDSIQEVTIGEGDNTVVLTNKALAEWVNEISDPSTDELYYYSLNKASQRSIRNPNGSGYTKCAASKIYVPISLFDYTTEYSSLKITFKSEEYADMTGVMNYRNIGAHSLTIRVKDSENSDVLHTYTFTEDDLRNLPIQNKIETSANDGMAGLRSYMAEGVYLTDILNAAGVKFDEGMELYIRTTDCATTNDGNGGTEDAYMGSAQFTYEDLMGVDRYHYPAMWDNTPRSELDGKSIYETLVADRNAWKYGNNDTLAALIGQSAQKIESPLIALAWNEGVVGWDGTNPATQSWGSNTYNPYTSHMTYRFLFGMKRADDGSVYDDATTFSNTYGVFGVDIIANGNDWKADSGAIDSGVTIQTPIQLRHANANGDTKTSITLNNVSDEWKASVKSVKVIESGSSDEPITVPLSEQGVNYSNPSGGTFSLCNNKLTIGRNETNPVFIIKPGEGEPIDISGRFDTTTYPQSKTYVVAIEAEGYEPVTQDVTFYTGSANTFSIIIDEDGSASTDYDRTVVKTYTDSEIQSMLQFQNGTSYVSESSIRSFSALGVPFSKLVEGVDVSENDSFKLDTTDDYGRTLTYDQLFGEQYFIGSVYDDPEVKAAYDNLGNGTDFSDIRSLLAKKAIENRTTYSPMLFTNCIESSMTKDQIGNNTFPTQENTHFDSLFGAENQYRFFPSISLAQEDKTISFNTGEDATQIDSQTVKSNLMTSTANTSIRGTYWTNALIVFRDAGNDSVEPSGTDKITKPEDPIREGFTFSGWYTDEACTDTNVFDFTANNGTVSKDTVLYAKWIEANEDNPENPAITTLSFKLSFNATGIQSTGFKDYKEAFAALNG